MKARESPKATSPSERQPGRGFPLPSSPSHSESGYSSSFASPTPSTSSSDSKSSKKWVRKEKIGQGAQGSVYRCEEVGSGKQIAAKIIMIQDLSPAEVQAIKREVETMKRLEHRYLVHYHKATEKKQQRLIIYMEYVAGGSLSHMLRQRGALAIPLVKKYTRQLCQVLEYLHANRIAHRDIKCANIFVSATEKSIKLGDFGAFKEIGSVSLVGGLKGTPHWMAPEVIREQQTSEDGWLKADIWSLGCAILEMLTGHSPWQQYSNPLTAMYQIVSSNNTPTIPADASEETTSFLKWCLQRNPGDRPTTMQLLAHSFLKKEGRRKSTASTTSSSTRRQLSGTATATSDGTRRQSLQKLQLSKQSTPDEDEANDTDACSPYPAKDGPQQHDDDDNERERSHGFESAKPQSTLSKERRKKSVMDLRLSNIPSTSSGNLKKSRIPRLLPLEPSKSSTNQEHEKEATILFSEKPSFVRGVSAGALNPLPRLQGSKTASSNGISISPVRLRRISTAPTPPGRDSDELVGQGMDRFKLPPLSARNAAGS
uniref:Protein kinase domain-containing protein n=1 Tax=Globisporangium ultimum (strain ATCC 200006 / CBS 805.95 / DAOM BR144) TaxID=431595 RepID=K3WBT5_GLOUD